MKQNFKALLIILAASMMMLTVAQNASAITFATAKINFEITNADDFGIPIRWELDEGPYYDEVSELIVYDSMEVLYHYLFPPIDHTLGKSKYLWSKGVAKDVWDMKTTTFVALPKKGLQGIGMADATGDLHVFSGWFVAQRSGWMTVKLKYMLEASANSDRRNDTASARGDLEISLSNHDRDTIDSKNFDFKVEAGRLVEEYHEAGSIVLRVYFRRGQMGGLHWYFLNRSKAERTLSPILPCITPCR